MHKLTSVCATYAYCMRWLCARFLLHAGNVVNKKTYEDLKRQGLL